MLGPSQIEVDNNFHMRDSSFDSVRYSAESPRQTQTTVIIYTIGYQEQNG